LLVHGQEAAGSKVGWLEQQQQQGVVELAVEACLQGRALQQH
jgi:hypothetical protein